MIPFRNPPWRNRQIDQKYRKKDKLVSKTVKLMMAKMEAVIDEVLENGIKTGKFIKPTLNDLYAITDDFYRALVTEAFYSAKTESKGIEKNQPPLIKPEKSSDQQLTKLAGAKWPLGVPKTLPGLEKIFRDKNSWPKIMKRSKKVTDLVREEYLRKLGKKFDEVIPRLNSGDLTADEAKTQLRRAWKATESRVELIFRTETTTYFAKVQVAYFNQEDGIIGFLFDALRDRATTEWCRSRHGLIYRPGSSLLTQNLPPCHWNCRSHLIPLANTPQNQKMLADPARDPENKKVSPLPSGWRR